MAQDAGSAVMSLSSSRPGQVPPATINFRQRLIRSLASRRLCRLLWPLLAVAPAAGATAISGAVMLHAWDYPNPAPVRATFGPNWANIRLFGQWGWPGSSKFDDIFAGQLVAQYEERVLLGSTATIPLRFIGTPNGSLFARDAWIDVTATFHIDVDPITFSEYLGRICCHFSGSQAYTADAPSSVQLQETRNTRFLGSWTYEIEGDEVEIAADANITYIRRDTLRHDGAVAALEARHRDSGRLLLDWARISDPAGAVRFQFTEPGWWDVQLYWLWASSSVLTEEWWGVSADLWYGSGHTSIDSPPSGPPLYSYGTGLWYYWGHEDNLAFSVFVHSGPEPVSEPHLTALLGFGLAGLGLSRRRKA